MTEKKQYILLADDDVTLSTVLSDYLRNAGFVVETVVSGKKALQAIVSGRYDLAILDTNLPEKNGLQVLSSLAKSQNPTPVIMLTAENSREHIIRAFDLGCDDYVTKPFSMDILICRIRAILRRAQAGSASKETVFMLDGKRFDSVHQTLDGHHLSAKENDLLLMLCRNMNQVVDRHLILRTIWQTDDVFASRSLSVYANHLRGYLAGTKVQIMGLHGKGYKLITE